MANEVKYNSMIPILTKDRDKGNIRAYRQVCRTADYGETCRADERQ